VFIIRSKVIVISEDVILFI